MSSQDKNEAIHSTTYDCKIKWLFKKTGASDATPFFRSGLGARTSEKVERPAIMVEKAAAARTRRPPISTTQI
jgi:hypothetical protein